MTQRTAREKCYWLIEQLLDSKIGTWDFCDEFHMTFDDEADPSEFSEVEMTNFQQLDNVIVRYSGLLADHKLFPNSFLSTDADVARIVAHVVQELGIRRH